jgi:hypothetical protein
MSGQGSWLWDSIILEGVFASQVFEKGSICYGLEEELSVSFFY